MQTEDINKVTAAFLGAIGDLHHARRECLAGKYHEPGRADAFKMAEDIVRRYAVSLGLDILPPGR